MPVSAMLQGENDTTNSEQVVGPNGGRRSYTLFQGHSGPIHSATFSPLGDFILTSSADSTSMLSSYMLPAFYYSAFSWLTIFRDF